MNKKNAVFWRTDLERVERAISNIYCLFKQQTFRSVRIETERFVINKSKKRKLVNVV